MELPKSILLPPEPARAPVVYPESDGEPLGETGFHVDAILHLREVLLHFFRRDDKVYVGTDMFLYYEEGNPAARRAPDIFVVKGVGSHQRRTYKMWEEKVAPCTVIDVSSRQTWLEDRGDKRALYETLGVAEYFLFDPLGEYLDPRLQGYELAGGSYRPTDPSQDGTLSSRELGLILGPEGALLRLVDLATGEVLPSFLEAAERAEAEAERAEAQAERARTAEAEVARLREELEKARRASGDRGGP